MGMIKVSAKLKCNTRLRFRALAVALAYVGFAQYRYLQVARWFWNCYCSGDGRLYIVEAQWHWLGDSYEPSSLHPFRRISCSRILIEKDQERKLARSETVSQSGNKHCNFVKFVFGRNWCPRNVGRMEPLLVFISNFSPAGKLHELGRM